MRPTRPALLSCGPAVVLLALALTPGTLLAGDWPAPGERRVSFDAAWRFSKGDPPGAEQPRFDDSTWRLLDLPHDWAI
ncbi:MAG TPA: hypothetical protein VLL75_00330, partial [Vicinamibacteria bacterium]|nr:hypothetical protein [Vicinamibacteria bacterium]